ncbi:Staphylococcal nuclease domain-containing protein 1 [Schistosoma japonicum]|nr:Staphylococcal nuclease domain-containing protein 1 [Schistosoma japonicum]
MTSPLSNKQDPQSLSSPSFFLGIVKQVLAGDTIVVRDRPIDGPPPERIIVLSNISCGRVARRPTSGNPTGTPEDSFAWEAREFCRTLLIGKEVCYSVETELPSGRKYGCVYIGKSTNGENVALSLIEQGLAEVRKLNPTIADKNKMYQLLVTAQEQAKSLGKGRWSPNSAITREIVWSVEDARNFFEKYKNQPLKAVVESVRDGCSLQVFILPESLREKPNTFVYLTITMTGIKSPSTRYENGKMVAEPWGLDAQFFTESRLLQRDVTILLESIFSQNFVGSILHPNGNIAELLLRQGLARCIDWNLNLVSVPGAAEAYKAAERFAKEKRLRLWENYQPTQAMEVHVDNVKTIIPGKVFNGFVTAQVDYIQPKTSNTVDERVCATVRADDVNLALLLVSKGLASVIRYRNSSDPRTVYYSELLAAEEDAQSKGFGMYCKQDPPIHRVTDLTGNVAKSRQFMSFLQRAERLDGVVEFVFSASRYRIYIPRETCIITLLLAGIQCPRRGRVETIDRVGNFVGWLFLEIPSTGQSNEPDTNKPLSKKKKKKTTDVTSVRQKANLSLLLISQGFGTVHRAPATERSPYYHDMIKAEDDAKTNQCGLWSSDEFVKEWEAVIQNNSDPTALSGAEDGNPISLTGFSEYLDDLSELQINEDGDAANENNGETTKQLSWKPAQITGISRPASSSQGLRFFAQHLSDACTLVKISQTLNNQSFPSFPPEYYPKKGSICIACFSLDNCWYRARVIRSSPKSVTVQFIDFGNEEVIDAAEYSSRLSPLPASPLMQLPPQVKEYRLAFVQLPPDSTDRAFAERAFCNLVENKEVRLAVQYESVPCGNETVKPVPAVTLLLPVADMNTSGSSVCSSDIDISESLLSSGLVCVEPIQPQFLNRLPRQLLHKYLDAQALAKKERKNIWQYGDFRADVDQL